jgi:CRP/FNR family transcriptional regulator, dissimilatory nitrate respiration regulator
MLSDRDLDILMRAPLFRAMGEKIAMRMIGDRQPRDCARGERIFEEGEPAAGFFCVIEGWAKLYRLREGGAEVVVALVAEGETFAEAVMFSGGRYPVSCEAATRARILKVDAVSLRREVMAEPQLAFDMLAAISIRLRELVNEVEQVKARSAPQRIAEFLLQQAGVVSGAARLTLPYEKALIAARLGMQPESFSRGLGKLAQIGVAVDREDVIIRDVVRLAAFAEGQ